MANYLPENFLNLSFNKHTRGLGIRAPKTSEPYRGAFPGSPQYIRPLFKLLDICSQRLSSLTRLQQNASNIAHGAPTIHPPCQSDPCVSSNHQASSASAALWQGGRSRSIPYTTQVGQSSRRDPVRPAAVVSSTVLVLCRRPGARLRGQHNVIRSALSQARAFRTLVTIGVAGRRLMATDYFGRRGGPEYYLYCTADGAEHRKHVVDMSAVSE